MRIITGTLKGRKLTTPAGADIRPTSDRAKESIFAVIDVRKYIAGSSVLDLFAGSGNLGFEAISRGADQVVYVESDRAAIDHIEKTAREFRVDDRMYGVCSTVEQYLNGPARPFDLIFADPPYDYEQIPDLPDLILQNNWLREDGWFILEHDKRHTFVSHSHCVFSKPYGRTIVSIFTRDPDTNSESGSDSDSDSA